MLGSLHSWRGMLAAFVLASLAGGCRTSHPQHEGYWIRSDSPGGPADARPAPYPAEYELDAGADLGFLLAEDVLFAVTGPDHTELEPGRYCWHIRPGTGPDMATIRSRSLVKLAAGAVVVSILVGGRVSASAGITLGWLPF